MARRRYKFFFHYNKQKDAITIHYRGKCHSAIKLTCYTNCFSKFNKRQPRLVMWGYADTLKQWAAGCFILDNGADR